LQGLLNIIPENGVFVPAIGAALIASGTQPPNIRIPIDDFLTQ
jgi:hypothetical protein